METNLCVSAAEVSRILKDVELLSSNGWQGTRRTFPVESTARILEFIKSIDAVPRAFDLELISSQRFIQILVSPFITLAKSCSASAPAPPILLPTMTAEMKRTAARDATFLLWTDKLLRTVAGAESYLDSQDKVQPVMGPKKHDEFLQAMLDAKIPEVRARISLRALNVSKFMD